MDAPTQASSNQECLGVRVDYDPKTFGINEGKNDIQRETFPITKLKLIYDAGLLRFPGGGRSFNQALLRRS